MRGRYRWWIGGLLFLSTVINYLDRQTLSVLAPSLKTEFHWTNQDFALVVISFRVAYAVMQTVSGRCSTASARATASRSPSPSTRSRRC